MQRHEVYNLKKLCFLLLMVKCKNDRMAYLLIKDNILVTLSDFPLLGTSRCLLSSSCVGDCETDQSTFKCSTRV